jgi:serine/threonine protein kinase
MMLGKGGFGTVYKYGQQHAIKQGKYVAHQYDILSQLTLKHHPNIISVFAYFHSPPSFSMQGLFKEDHWMELGLFISSTSTSISSKNKLLAHWLPQLVDAVEFIHQQGVAHCDIKPANIFIRTILNEESNVGIKLIDFGLACNKDQCNAPRGTPDYWSPEAFLLFGEKHVPRTLKEYMKDDLWAMGMTLFEAIHGNVIAKFFPGIKTTQDLRSFYQYIRGSNTIPLVDDVEYIPYRCITSKRYIFQEKKAFLAGQNKRLNYHYYLRIDPNSRKIPSSQIQQHTKQKIKKFRVSIETIYNTLREARQRRFLKKKQSSLLAVIRGVWRDPTLTFQDFIQQAKNKVNIQQDQAFFQNLLQNRQDWGTFMSDMITTTRARQDEVQTLLTSKHD